jgi:F420-non-reducing hydrogenase iron-sulfur subunit
LICSGALDPVYVLKPLLEGADGVLIGGCHPGDCQYQDGNYKAQQRVDTLKKTPKGVGIYAERVWLRWIAASEVEILKRGQK